MSRKYKFTVGSCKSNVVSLKLSLSVMCKAVNAYQLFELLFLDVKEGSNNDTYTSLEIFLDRDRDFVLVRRRRSLDLDRLKKNKHTICPGSSDPIYIVSYYIRRVTTFLTHSIIYNSVKHPGSKLL